MDTETKIAVLEERHKKDTENILKRLSNIEKLTDGVLTLANEVKHMREDITNLGNRVESMEQTPKKRWDTVITSALSALVGIFLGIFFGA